MNLGNWRPGTRRGSLIDRSLSFEVVMPTLTLGAVSSRSLHIPGADPWHAAPGDPALSVMTDFRERASVTVAETATIDAALEHMKHTGVRCAFVIDESRRVVVGLITAYDIMSEKPMRHMQAMASPRREVHVRDVMHAISDWRVLDIKTIERATVASVARLFDETGLTHVPVMETSEAGEQRLRGLLSGAKVKRLLANAPAP
jgi:CBS domain-containing protein